MKCILCGAFPLTDEDVRVNRAAAAVLDAALAWEASLNSYAATPPEVVAPALVLRDAIRAYRAAKEGTA